MSLLLMKPGMGGRLLVAPPPASPSVSIAADDATVSITTNGTIDIVVTITRGGGYTDTQTLGVTGLPTGVTASYPDGQTFSGGTTQRRVRLTGSSAPDVTNDAFQITATGTINATPIDGTVTVAAPGAWAPNLPSGMTLVADSSFETFTDTTASSSDSDGIEVINWTSNITEDAASFGVRSSNNSGGYGSKSIRAWFPGNHAGEGVGPLTLLVSDLNAVEHYMVTRMRYSSNYVVHDNTEKLFYPVQNVAGEGNWGAGSLNLHPAGLLVGVSGPIQTAPVSEAKTAAGVIPIGSWFMAEFYIKMNTPGNSDGEWKVWVDGVNVMNVTNWQFSNNPTTQMYNTLGRQDMTRGGGTATNLTPPEGQWVEVDRVAFYKR